MGFAGIYRGLVVDDRDPEQRLRVRVKVPQLMGNANLAGWAEGCLPPGWADNPLTRPPSPGEQVWVMFEGGDVDFPVWMGVVT